jgi:rubrerythrin
MESVEKLRTAARNMAKGRNLEHHEDCNLLLIIADEIEHEIEEKYMLLPVDADGVPIHVGDALHGAHEKPVHRVLAVGHGEYVCDGQVIRNANLYHHVEPDPVKELLEDFAGALEKERDFTDGSTHPHTLNRVGREVDYIEVDGERYERVRECELEHHDTGWVSCRECNTSWKNDRPHVYRRCPYCGAKVVRS